MALIKDIKFESQSFSKRLKSMLSVDFRRMFTMPLFYIMVGVSVVIPILILVMTTMMDGSTNVNPSTGEVTVIEGFDNVWQAIGSISGSNTMSMDLTSMCNINMMYFILAVLVCIFVADDFRSGYAKNLFTVRSSKVDYVISKTFVCFVGGAFMIIGYFVGAMLGGAFSNLSFATTVGTSEIFMCMLSKIFLVGVFVAIFLLMSIIAKQKLWLSLVISLGGSMLLFMMIPMLTPLDSTIMNVIICLVGGVLFSIGLGVVSNLVLKKTSLI